MPPLRLALVGLGDIAVRAHLPAIMRNDDVVLAAVVEPDAQRRERACELVPEAHATDAVDDVLHDAAIDAVVLATPAWVTVQLARDAVAAGKYVLAEKPLAPTLEEQLALAAVPGVAERLQVGLTYRHHPAIDRLRALVAADAFGRPLYVQSAVCDERADPVGNPAHYGRRRQTLEHGPPVVFDGIHACDRLNVVLGEEPVDVTAWGLTTSPEFASPNVNGSVLRYADGSLARLEVIWLVPSLPASEFVLTGPRGRAVLVPPTFELMLELDGERELIAPPGEKEPYCFSLQLERFVGACRSSRPPVPGIADAIAASRLCERIAGAIQSRSSVA